MASPRSVPRQYSAPSSVVIKKKKSSAPAFILVLLLLLGAGYAYYANTPQGAAPAKAEKKAAMAPKTARRSDVNSALAPYAISEGSKNLLAGAKKVSVSAADDACPATNAVDGSCENDANVAVARPAGGENAWWQVEAAAGKEYAGDCVVIYGGGTNSPAGKLIGGFRVDVEYADGETDSREFCKPGFALEGHEAWQLGNDSGVRSIRVSALRADTPIVLREVQLIGPAH